MDKDVYVTGTMSNFRLMLESIKKSNHKVNVQEESRVISRQGVSREEIESRPAVSRPNTMNNMSVNDDEERVTSETRTPDPSFQTMKKMIA